MPWKTKAGDCRNRARECQGNCCAAAEIKLCGVAKGALKILPIYIRTYRQAYIHKIPLIMQNVMIEMQGMLKPMQEKLAEIQKQTLQEMKDLKASEGAAAKSHGASTS
jgi:hypothetical protein